MESTLRLTPLPVTPDREDYRAAPGAEIPGYTKVYATKGGKTKPSDTTDGRRSTNFPCLIKPELCRVGRTAFVGLSLVVKASVSSAEGRGSNPSPAIPVTYNLVLWWLPCHSLDVAGSVVWLVGPVSIYCLCEEERLVYSLCFSGAA